MKQSVGQNAEGMPVLETILQTIAAHYSASAICHSGRFQAGIQILTGLKDWIPDRSIRG
jgi:hypothetical protein